MRLLSRSINNSFLSLFHIDINERQHKMSYAGYVCIYRSKIKTCIELSVHILNAFIKSIITKTKPWRFNYTLFDLLYEYILYKIIIKYDSSGGFHIHIHNGFSKKILLISHCDNQPEAGFEIFKLE